ncbi:Acg family FMN-binding oxidoreductase [Nocardia grenadensis]|uniref:Acg family FMN-binding oxidoreductase n=1 Tax=Nocardia grenadensis TaxID=931537 RepID=UPI0007A49A7C|nr:nitroreductase family protein [Nocardia grenadensis]
MTDNDVPGATYAPDRATLFAAMRVAARAPSVHNTQPWRWVYRDGRLRLYRDDERLLTSADPSGRQLVISCGTMLHHVRAAFAAAGWRTGVERMPDPGDPGLLAVLTFAPWPDAPAALRTLPEVIERRRTDRLSLLDPGDLSGRAEAARLSAHEYGVELDVLDAEAAARLSRASEHSAALRHYDMPYHSELQWWAGHENLPEGVPATALVSEVEAARVPVGRKFPTPARAAHGGEQEDRAQLWVLTTAGESGLAWLRTGEALSEILLECTAAGLATCTLTHITELPTTRRIASTLIGGHGTAQVVLRVGLAPHRSDQEPTPRRPVTDFLTVHPDTFATGDAGVG